LQAKINLGLFKAPKLSLDGWQVEPHPLLLFGDCSQKWIDNNADDIDKKIKTVACGAYYSGSSKGPLDLSGKKAPNRHLFKVLV
jgi:hypothetical protein